VVQNNLLYFLSHNCVHPFIRLFITGAAVMAVSLKTARPLVNVTVPPACGAPDRDQCAFMV
jgi:hypothetical protein